MQKVNPNNYNKPLTKMLLWHIYAKKINSKEHGENSYRQQTNKMKPKLFLFTSIEALLVWEITKSKKFHLQIRTTKRNEYYEKYITGFNEDEFPIFQHGFRKDELLSVDQSLICLTSGIPIVHCYWL